MDNKKTWTNNFVYAYRGIAKHHCNYKQVKAHVFDASIGYYSSCFYEYGEFR